MHGSIATSSAKSVNMSTICQEHFIAKVELDWLKPGFSINANKDMDG